jgi:hypothetical protein
MSGKQQSSRKQKTFDTTQQSEGNLGQNEARLEKEKASESADMGNASLSMRLFLRYAFARQARRRCG